MSVGKGVEVGVVTAAREGGKGLKEAYGLMNRNR
jgi:hypothetical protein